MKKVYYKGIAYDYKVMGDSVGKRKFLLYKNSVLMHYIDEDELDKKSIVSIVLDAYFGKSEPAMQQ